MCGKEAPARAHARLYVDARGLYGDAVEWARVWKVEIPTEERGLESRYYNRIPINR